MTEISISRQLPGPAATAGLGAELALVARPGMAILLEGDVGSGKSTLARAFIRALAAPEVDFDIPSPTFTLVQTYGQTRIPVTHADLYRIEQDVEIEELGLDESLGRGIVLIEWPERLPAGFSMDTLHVVLSGSGESRTASLRPTGSWAPALHRLEAINTFLKKYGWSAASRTFLEGDASFRRYERLSRNRQTYVLMDMARRPDGPPVKDGKPYSQIAHLAEDIRAVVAVNEELRRRGLSAPETYACDCESGLAVIEDLGNRVYGGMMLAGEAMAEPMNEAVRVLARMAVQEWPQAVSFAGAGQHRIPAYDRQALEIEIGLLTDWCWPFLKDEAIGHEVRDEFMDIWSPLLATVEHGPTVWTLRDYHSPNLMWLPDRQGLARVGLIDTQDCVLGHPAYDLASMLQDARVDVAFSLADELFEAYCRYRRDTSPFDESSFRLAYAILGAQRATKILGIFARLSKRDGKHGYLRHVPRVSRYLERNLEHPALSGLKKWYSRHLPPDLRESRSP